MNGPVILFAILSAKAMQHADFRGRGRRRERGRL